MFEIFISHLDRGVGVSIRLEVNNIVIEKIDIRGDVLEALAYADDFIKEHCITDFIIYVPDIDIVERYSNRGLNIKLI